MRFGANLGDVLPRLLFLVGFGILCLLFGIASAQREFFPYPLVRDAWQAAKAARNLLFERGDEAWAPDDTKRRYGDAGVLRYDEAQAYDGLTLFTSWHAPEALLIDMQGDVVHRWDVPFSRALATVNSDRAAVPDDEVILRRATLLPDGDLLGVYERPNQTPYGWGLARFSPDGTIEWVVVDHLHHDVAIGPDGRYYGLAQDVRSTPIAGLDEVVPPFYDEFIVVISPDGEILDRLSIFTAFATSPFREALTSLADLDDPRGDYLHPNAVQVVTSEVAADVPGWQAGQVLVSLLGMDGLAVIDLESRQVVDFIHGIWREQHDPDLLENGNVLLFDNQGDLEAGMHSQILEIDPVTNEVVWRFRTNDAESFYSKALGSQQPLPNGNVLITESLRGRLLEVTREGEIVWEYLNPAERDGFHEFLMSGERVPADMLDRLQDG